MSTISRTLGLLCVTAVATVLGGSAASSTPDRSPAVATVTLPAVADTTATQVAQDGDTAVRTTLATCPQVCDGNPAGRRDAVLEFAVAQLPANAVAVGARLRVYAWRAASARVVVHAAQGGARGTGTTDQVSVGAALQARDRVVPGYNDWDVSAAVRRNGTYTFALRQETPGTRTYWASRENGGSSVRPVLLLSYRGVGRPADGAATPGPLRSTPPADPPPWRQVFADEFDDTTVDRSVWNVRDEARDVDRGCNTSRPQNVFEAGGVLTIRALRERTTCGSQVRQYTQGYLDTIGRASFTYGRFEVRARSPTHPDTSRGLWPAFWLRPDDGGNGEIDVVELPGGPPYHSAVTQAIFYDYTPIKQDNRSPLPTGHPADGFHVYTTEWEPGALRWYVDGRQVYQRDRSTTPWFDAAFSRPFNLRLNLQVGGWLGDPDATTAFPADFQVDYVRVWQR